MLQLSGVDFNLSSLLVERPMLDCEHIHEELRTHMDVNLTLSQLWLEYNEQHPDRCEHTQFCQL